MRKLFLSALTFGSTLAAFLQSTATTTNGAAIYADGTAPYNSGLSCFNCIQNDYIFCVQGSAH